MEKYILKLRHILPTFFAVTLGTVFGLGFIRWLFFIQFSIIDINEGIWEFWIPIIFPFIPIFIWLEPRFSILTFNNGKSNSSFFLISMAVIGAMLYFSQCYLTTATGKLVELASIHDIDKVEKARYYKLTDFSVDHLLDTSFTNFTQSGKNKKNLDLDIYFVTPILKDTSERMNPAPKYWFGISFNKTINNNLNTEEKDRLYNAFYNGSFDIVYGFSYHAVDHYERKPLSDEDRQYFLKAIEAKTKQATDESFIVLEPVLEKYEDRNGDNFVWIFGSFGIGLGVLLFSLIWPKYDETKMK